MRIEYYKDADVAYIYFKEITEGEVVQTISLNDSVSIDLDKEGRTLGIEILNASKNLPLNAINLSMVVD